MVIWSSDESAVVGSLVVAGSLEFGPLAPNVTVLAFVSVNQFNFQWAEEKISNLLQGNRYI